MLRSAGSKCNNRATEHVISCEIWELLHVPREESLIGFLVTTQDRTSEKS